MSDNGRAQQVGDEFIALAVPHEQRGAGTAAAVDLEKIVLLVACNLDFILQDTRGPEHAHDIGFLRVAEADGEIRRVLPEIAI